MAAIDQSTGQIQRAITTVRQFVDQSRVNAKYSDADILGFMNQAWAEVIGDLYSNSVCPPLVKHSVTLVQDQYWYDLPSSIGEIRQIMRKDTNGNYLWEIEPKAFFSPEGPGISFEGNQRFWTDPWHGGSSGSIELLYIPNGDVTLFLGTATFPNTTASTVKPTVTTLGSLDRRPNAYAGSYVGLLAANDEVEGTDDYFVVQQRICESYDARTGTLTVKPEFDYDISTWTPGDGDVVTVEVYPAEAPVVWPTICYHVARQLAGIEGHTDKFKMLTQLYMESKRAACLRWANFQTRNNSTFQVDHYADPNTYEW